MECLANAFSFLGGRHEVLACGTHYTVRFGCVLHGPGSARVCCASKASLTRAGTTMKFRVRAACCAATVFALRTNNWSRSGEMIADLCRGKAGLGKCGSACYALHQFAASAHIYATAFGPPKRLQVLVYSTLPAETVVTVCLFAGCVCRPSGVLFVNFLVRMCLDDLCRNTRVTSNVSVLTSLKRRESNIHWFRSTSVRHGLQMRRKCTSGSECIVVSISSCHGRTCCGGRVECG